MTPAVVVRLCTLILGRRPGAGVKLFALPSEYWSMDAHGARPRHGEPAGSRPGGSSVTRCRGADSHERTEEVCWKKAGNLLRSRFGFTSAKESDWKSPTPRIARP